MDGGMNEYGFANTMGFGSRTERYFKALKEGKVRGYMFEQQNYVPAGTGAKELQNVPHVQERKGTSTPGSG